MTVDAAGTTTPVSSHVFGTFVEGSTRRLAEKREVSWLVGRIRSGPPPGFFRIGWVRCFPSLNEFFVHQEDVRRANGLSPRETLIPSQRTLPTGAGHTPSLPQVRAP